MKPVLFTSLFFCNTLFAQQAITDTPAVNNTPASYATAGISYISNIVFAGRKDSVAVPYISPSIAYYHKSGFYSSGSLSYLSSATESRVDLFTLTAGFTYEKKEFIAEINATKYFFSDKSSNVQSQISGYAGAYAGYNFKNIITLFTDASVTFSSKPDIFWGTEASHSFYADKDRLKISPSAYINFGTQNYYNEYYSYRTHSTGGNGGGTNGNGQGSGSTQTTATVSVTESKKFQLLNYELSLPVAYWFGNFKLFATPVYAIPVNPSAITVNGFTTKETLSNTFYWQAGVEYSFEKKRKVSKRG
jgi:hypothetical protein